MSIAAFLFTLVAAAFGLTVAISLVIFATTTLHLDMLSAALLGILIGCSIGTVLALFLRDSVW